MQKNTLRLGAAALVLASLGTAQAQPAGDQPAAPAPTERLAIELNKLEPVAGACRMYFVIDNATPVEFTEIQLDVFIFDREGIIDQRVALSPSGIRPMKTRVVLFDLAGVECETMGRFLVNDVTCETPTGPSADCAQRLTVTSRVDAVFEF